MDGENVIVTPSAKAGGEFSVELVYANKDMKNHSGGAILVSRGTRPLGATGILLVWIRRQTGRIGLSNRPRRPTPRRFGPAKSWTSKRFDIGSRARSPGLDVTSKSSSFRAGTPTSPICCGPADASTCCAVCRSVRCRRKRTTWRGSIASWRRSPRSIRPRRASRARPQEALEPAPGPAVAGHA